MFQDECECLAFLQATRWSGKPRCPYCGSLRCCLTSHDRFHCNLCNTNFSVTAKTIFHGTHIPLTKWFASIPLVVSDRYVSTRSLAIAVGVNRNTAARIISKIMLGMLDTECSQLIHRINVLNGGKDA